MKSYFCYDFIAFFAMIAKKLKDPNSSGWFDHIHCYTDFSPVVFFAIVERLKKLDELASGCVADPRGS